MNDKNSLIGMSLMVGLLMIYFIWFQPDFKQKTTQSQPQTTEEVQDAITDATEVETDAGTTSEVADSVRKAQLSQQYGNFSSVMEGSNDTLTITTDMLTVKLNTRGGNIYSAVLNTYNTQDSAALPIIDQKFGGLNEFEFEFVLKGNSNPVQSRDIFFKPSVPGGFTVTGDEEKELKLVADVGNGKSVEQIYTFKGSTFDVGYKINFPGLRKDMKNPYYELRWTSIVPQTEQGFTAQKQKTDLVYMRNKDMERMGGMSSDDEKEFVDNGIDWISFKSQFFTHALLPKKPIQSANLETRSTAPLGRGGAEIEGEGNGFIKVLNARMDINLNKEGVPNEFTLFMGPNEYQTLKSYGVGLQKEMDLGYFFISNINVATIWIFKQLEKYVSSYGIIILIFAVFVKLIVFPFTYKSYVSMGKLRVLNQADEMKALDEKYKDDAQKLQMEKMGIYRKMGVSPLGGCLPMLFSYPFLIAMFFFFPQAIELRHEGFLWAHDLSTYDSIYNFGFDIPGYGDHISLFTILMAISIYIYTYFQQKSQPPNAAMPFMKYIPYFIPIIFVVFLNNYAAALSWYYLCSNLVSIIQTTAIRATINDDKMLAEMREKAKSKKAKKGKNGKGGKGGAGKSRMENWLAKQQKKQEEMTKAKKQNAGKTRRDRRGK